MVASSLLSDAAFVSDGSSYAVHQLVLLLGSAMTALNACVEAKEKEATWEVTTHHCLASLGFIAGFVPFLKDASILEDFCRYVMSVLPCVLEANLADEVLVKDVVLLMEKMSRFVDGEKRDDVMGEMESVVVEKKVLVSAELEKRCEEEEESDSSSYTYESYYSYETVSDEELPPSMPTLVSAPEKPEKEKPVEEEEDWGFEEEEKKDEDWGFDEKEEKKEEEDWGFEEEKEEVKEPVEEKAEVKKVEVKEKKKDEKKAEVKEEKKEEKPEEKKVKKVEVKEEVKEEKKPVEEKKKEPSTDKNSTSTALARTEKKLEVDEHLWDDDDEPVKPARATRRGRKKEEVKEEKKEEVKKEEKEEEKPVAKPVEKAKPEVKKEEKPVEEKPEEKVEVKKEEEKKPSVDKNSTSTALARTEKKLEVDEHLWDDDDEPVKPARATRRGRKKEKAPVERVVIEPPLRSEKLFSDDEEEKKPKKTRRGRSGRSQALATFEASWDEEEVKPAEKSAEEKAEAKVEEKPVEKPVEEVKVEEKPEEEVKAEEKPVEKAEAKPSEKVEKKEEKAEEKKEKKEKSAEKEVKEEKVEEKEKKKEENWDFASDNDSGLEWSDQEQSTPTNTPTPTTPTNTPTTPITVISSTTVASYTAVPDMTPLCTSPTTTSPVLLQACRVLDLLLSSSLLLPACHCFQCYIPAVKKEPSLLCHFVDKLVRQIGAREMKEEEAKALTEIVTILVEDNECVTRAASDLALELFLAFHKKEEVSCIPKQLVLLVLSFYQQKREPWLITVFIHMFSAALSHHSMEQVTQCLVMLAATLQKLNAEDSQFLIAVCGMPIIDAILSVWNVMDKEALAALVPFAALLYGKTEKKEEIVELVLHLCGIALKRSIQLQPLNVKKCDEDADLVKVNSMIGELLFVMVRVNAESFKKGLQCLPAEKVSVIQEQLRHTIQVKQSETNAAKRRNASRMPVKLDASKFTNE